MRAGPRPYDEFPFSSYQRPICYNIALFAAQSRAYQRNANTRGRKQLELSDILSATYGAKGFTPEEIQFFGLRTSEDFLSAYRSFPFLDLIKREPRK